MPGRVRLLRTTPEEQGVASRGLLAFVDDVERHVPELHSLMVVRHGAVVAEGWWVPFARDRLHRLYSLSKSFTSMAVGLAQGEGLLSVDDLVLQHFGAQAPAEPGGHLARMRVRDLLTMTAGHDTDPSDAVFSGRHWVRDFLAQPVEHEPGTHFQYNTASTYMLSALVQKVTGQRLLDYLGPRVLTPLGITGVTWEQSPEGIDIGGSGLSATTEDIACFGWLLLNDGVWQGRRLLPEGWVAEATGPRVSNGDDPESEWAQGYGYQFWRCTHRAFRADGAFGQLAVVVPDQDVVVAITAGVADLGGLLDRLWAHLLPGLSEAPSAPDPQGHRALAERLARLELDPPTVEPTSSSSARVSGRTVAFEPNATGISAVVLHIGAEHDTLTAVIGGRAVSVDAGHGCWMAGQVQLGRPTSRRPAPEQVLSSGGWIAPDTYRLTVRQVEGPAVLTATATIADDDVTVTRAVNVAFGPTELPLLSGRLVEASRS
jgi:CubicO group peptidase (beta-lactamase class C family)